MSTLSTLINKGTLDKLEQLAKNAHPGPWQMFGEDNFAYLKGAEGEIVEIVSIWLGCNQEVADGRFIEAANPAMILELIRLVRAYLEIEEEPKDVEFD